MKPYLPLDCPDYHAINAEILDYIKNFTGLLTPGPQYNYCNFINPVKNFVLATPLLIRYLKEHKLYINDCYFALCWDKEKLVFHRDKPPVEWKMNWPVLNMEPSGIRFFKPKDQVDINITRHGDADSKAFDHYILDYDQFCETHRYQFEKKPIVMNGMVAHDVYWHNEPVFPRIGLQIMFVREPIHLL